MDFESKRKIMLGNKYVFVCKVYENIETFVSAKREHSCPDYKFSQEKLENIK